MLKAIIIFCAYLTTITTSTLGDPSSISCAAISCPSPSGCIDGLGCTKLCGTTASGTSTAICTDPKECVASNCVETCTSADECSAYPYAECSTKTINAESADICVPAIPTVTCEENETYYTVQDCKTCDGICNIDPFCTLSCRAGCYCDPGYVRDDYGGDCILEDECPTDLPSTTDPSNNCGDNEEYNECSSYCPESCTRPSGFTACPAICGPARCECMDGYVRNEFAECVLPDDCPTTMTPTCLGENKEYDTCGSYCPKSCDTLLYFDTIACVDMCVEGCFCKDGYVLDIEGNCVMEEDCDELDMSSTTTDAPSGCEIIDCDTSGGEVCAEDDGSGSAGCVVIGDTCEGCFRLGMPCGTCPDDINSFGACDGCTWQETYIGAKCADTISQCPDPTCEENEVVSNCNGHCRPTCETGEFIFCTLQCEPGCNCDTGYILDEEDGVCIPIEDCPTTIEPSTTDMASTDEIGTPGDVCGLPVDGDCAGCRALCGTCSDGETQYGCCGECYYDFDGETCVGYKPKICPTVECDDIECDKGEECVDDSDGAGTPGCVEECGENEVFTTCGTACPGVCGVDSPTICTLQCFVGCVCQTGYILESGEEDAECIPIDQCEFESTTPSPTYEFCGGIAGIPCDDEYICIDDPSDDCDPFDSTSPGADCGGICIESIAICDDNCVSWFDGCNECTCTDGVPGGCTEKACSIYEDPYCKECEDGYELDDDNECVLDCADGTFDCNGICINDGEKCKDISSASRFGTIVGMGVVVLFSWM